MGLPLVHYGLREGRGTKADFKKVTFKLKRKRNALRTKLYRPSNFHRIGPTSGPAPTIRFHHPVPGLGVIFRSRHTERISEVELLRQVHHHPGGPEVEGGQAQAFARKAPEALG